MNELCKLIELAKGKDRSIREYANDAGVNIATISRAIKGEITPSAKMLKRLTSEKAKPRNGITFESLHTAASVKNIQGSKENYALAIGALTAGVVGGAIASPFSVFSAFAGAATFKAINASKKRSNEQVQERSDNEIISSSERIGQFKRQQELFAATGMGILFGALAHKGISFRPGTLESQDTNGYGEEKLIHIENQVIDTWKFNFFSLVENDMEINTMAENMAINSILGLLFTEPRKTKKVSVVVKDKELFDNLKDICETNSYKGNLSIILIDIDNVCIAEEIILASYDSSDLIESMKLS